MHQPGKKPSLHWLFDSNQGKQYLIDLYHRCGWSMYQIAEKEEVSYFVIYKAFEYWNIPRRGKSEAQAAALKNMRARHPTEGRPRTPEEKAKIAETLRGNWALLPEDERARRLVRLNHLLEEIRKKRNA